MATHRYLLLLRGINVGGNNIIKMADLRECFEEMGFSNVVTYIQSGNIIFDSTKSNKETVSTIQKGLAKHFSYSTPVFLISNKQLKDVVSQAPMAFGKEPKKYRYDVMFLRSTLNASSALKQIETREGVDSAEAGRGAIYFSRLISKATRSYMPKVIKLPIYKDMTIRNWNTTNKLLNLLEE